MAALRTSLQEPSFSSAAKLANNNIKQGASTPVRANLQESEASTTFSLKPGYPSHSSTTASLLGPR